MEKEIDELMYAKNFEDAYDKILCYGISLLEALYDKNSTNDMQGYNYRKIIISFVSAK